MSSTIKATKRLIFSRSCYCRTFPYEALLVTFSERVNWLTCLLILILLRYFFSFFFFFFLFKNFYFVFLKFGHTKNTAKEQLNLWQMIQRTHSISMIIVFFLKGVQLAEIKNKFSEINLFYNLC